MDTSISGMVVAADCGDPGGGVHEKVASFYNEDDSQKKQEKDYCKVHSFNVLS